MIIFPLQGHTLVHALSSHTVNSPPTHLSGLYICVSTRCPNTATQLHSPNFTDRSLGPTGLRSTNWAIAGHQGTPLTWGFYGFGELSFSLNKFAPVTLSLCCLSLHWLHNGQLLTTTTLMLTRSRDLQPVESQPLSCFSNSKTLTPSLLWHLPPPLVAASLPKIEQ